MVNRRAHQIPREHDAPLNTSLVLPVVHRQPEDERDSPVADKYQPVKVEKKVVRMADSGVIK
jgi:hypothetical protein